MKLKIVSKANAPSEEEIAAFEAKIQKRLPNGYRVFIKENNPIQTQEKLYYLDDQIYSIDFWYPLSKDETLSLSSIHDWTIELLNNQYLPIGYDSGDWLFVIGLTEDNYNKVFFCRTDDVPPSSMTLLAETFEDFLMGLRAEG